MSVYFKHTFGYRKYQPIWEHIKQHDECILHITHPTLVSRIRQGVIKEKCNDMVFRLLNEMCDFRLAVTYNREKQQLHFRLVQRFGLNEKEI